MTNLQTVQTPKQKRPCGAAQNHAIRQGNKQRNIGMSQAPKPCRECAERRANKQRLGFPNGAKDVHTHAIHKKEAEFLVEHSVWIVSCMMKTKHIARENQ